LQNLVNFTTNSNENILFYLDYYAFILFLFAPCCTGCVWLSACGVAVGGYAQTQPDMVWEQTNGPEGEIFIVLQYQAQAFLLERIVAVFFVLPTMARDGYPSILVPNAFLKTEI
jgi:hypothetical protein